MVTLFTKIFTYKSKIENHLKGIFDKMEPKTELVEACRYAIFNGGKRVRPILMVLVAEALGKDLSVYEAASAIEFFHTTSLIADDLPSMDDDDYRRGKPSLHKAYSESVAIMASYALISEGYLALCRNTDALKAAGVPDAEKRGLLAIENVSYNAGFNGATGGQFLDLSKTQLNENQIEEAMIKKTASLFEISFMFGWLYGGGDLDKIEKVKELALHFGLAFQIVDDLKDYEQDKDKPVVVNYAHTFGIDQAKQAVKEKLDLCRALLKELHIATPELIDALDYIEP